MASSTLTVDRFEAGTSSILRGRTLWEVLWNRKSLVALGLAIGLSLGLLYYAQTPPVYQTKAKVLVRKKRSDNITGIDTRHLAIEDYVATQQELIKSPAIIERAVVRSKLATPESVLNEEELAESILRSLTVTRTRTTGANTSNVLDLSFRGTDAAKCSVVLNAIIDSYRSYLEEEYHSTSAGTLELVEKARNALQKDLKKQYEDYGKFREKAPFLMLRGKDGGNLAQGPLSSIDAKRSTLLVRKAELQGYLTTFEKVLAEGPKADRAALRAMVAEWTAKLEGDAPRNKERLTLHAQLYPLLLEEQKLLESRGEQHPEVQTVRRRIEVARNYLENPTAPFRNNNHQTAPVKEGAADPVETFRDFVKQQLGQIEVTERLLGDLFKERFDTAKVISDYEWEDEKFRLNIERTNKLIDSIIKKLDEVALIKDVGGYEARTIAPPGLGKKVHPSGLIIFPLALLVGGLLGGGLAYLAETTDKSFRSIDEIRSRLGVTVVGQIPFLKPHEAPPPAVAGVRGVLAPVLFTHHFPKSSEAESYRGVRTSLYFNAHGKGLKIIQVTSPNVGDGKSTLAANLAISIAQSGKKVLLIDADMRKPTVHKVFGVSAKVGLSSIIIDEAEPKDAIQDIGIPGLSILPCGPIPPNPSELLTSPRFEEFLNHLREQFDFVIVDTPPLLAVTDPSVVAHKVDGVLLNVRFTKNGRPDAERAREILFNLKANVIGVVVNDAEQLLKASGYSYGYAYGGEGYLQPAQAEARVLEDQSGKV